MEASFSITGEDEVGFIEGLGIFKYLGRKLYCPYYDWPTVRRNIRKVRQVWGRLGKLILRERLDQSVSEKIYWLVVQ